MVPDSIVSRSSSRRRVCVTPGRLSNSCCGTIPGTCAWISSTEMDAVVRVDPVPTTLTASSVRASCAKAGKLCAPASHKVIDARAWRERAVVRMVATEADN
ncbi:hypothetical protein XocVXO32_12170 [Xanthomonas oryzae pv. oryzicola]|uniref:hypothetical protein n=1 Tax=Xanthomonas oryzae TaxID=347 RepID=UPI0018A25B61